MDMYSPTTIASRVEFFPRSTQLSIPSSLLGQNIRREEYRVNSGKSSSNLRLVNFVNGNGSANEPETSGSALKSVKKSEKKYRVLHIEDDEQVRYLVQAFLKHYVDIQPVANGIEALNCTSNTVYDLIITDINLGNGLNGIETARIIRDMKNYADVPIIAATANADSEVRNECIDAGMDAFLLKPFMKNDLINTIDQVMCNR
jgi:CheY-like chemotaxis protein